MVKRINQARLSNAGLAHDEDNLPLAVPCLLEMSAESIQHGLAADKVCGLGRDRVVNRRSIFSGNGGDELVPELRSRHDELRLPRRVVQCLPDLEDVAAQ